MAADQLDPVALEPRHLTGIVEVADDHVAAYENRAHVEVPAHTCAAPGPRRLGQSKRGRSSASECVQARNERSTPTNSGSTFVTA
jgi:hypothetical protein